MDPFNRRRLGGLGGFKDELGFQGVTVLLFGDKRGDHLRDDGHQEWHRHHHHAPLVAQPKLPDLRTFECQDLMSNKDIHVMQKKVLGDAVGGFNLAIVLCEEVGTRRKLIQKQFLPRDLPRIYHAETSTLKTLRHCKYTVKMVANKDSSHRRPPEAWILFEYCNLGTLDDLLRTHVTNRRHFPESFVLRVLFSLVEAISYMHNGDVKPGHTDQSRGWLLHGDIHPGNVFLRTAPEASDSLDVLLGDFGSSHHFCTWQNEPRLGRDAAQHPYYLVRDSTWNRRSDVYQIGLVMVALCRLTTKPLDEVKRGGSACGSRYSSKLNELVGDCLRSNPQNRIRVAELRETLHSRRMAGSASLAGLLLKKPS
ncbi:kinase-like protein [Periconia macrospinosa]|uniref:non-specific serine/threonine protein kinase n=1 Tax=Periconia macrospinosa TaxID=97972 RepID=A0A2V1E5N2_9PLEO|nr:kinase-like protein [Periconia macrospinosa]